MLILWWPCRPTVYIRDGCTPVRDRPHTSTFPSASPSFQVHTTSISMMTGAMNCVTAVLAMLASSAVAAPVDTVSADVLRTLEDGVTSVQPRCAPSAPWPQEQESHWPRPRPGDVGIHVVNLFKGPNIHLKGQASIYTAVRCSSACRENHAWRCCTPGLFSGTETIHMDTQCPAAYQIRYGLIGAGCCLHACTLHACSAAL